MKIGVILSLITGFVSLVGLLIKWRISELKKREHQEHADRLEKMKKAFLHQQELRKSHEDKIIEISSGGVSDDRASELLSEPPRNPKISDSEDS